MALSSVLRSLAGVAKANPFPETSEPDSFLNDQDQVNRKVFRPLGVTKADHLPYDHGDEAPQHDWTALIDPRRDEVTPLMNPYKDLPARHAWLKDELATGKRKVDSIDSYFDGSNIGLTRREIYEREMGVVMADKAADNAEQQQSESSLSNRLAQAGVTDVVRHPVTGTPVFVGADGSPIPHDSILTAGTDGRVVVDANGNPYDVVTGQGKSGASNILTGEPTSFDESNGFDSRSESETLNGNPSNQEINHALSTVLMKQHEFKDPATQQALKHIKDYLQTYPAPAKRAPLHSPGMGQAIITLALAGILPRNVAMSVLSMPFAAQLKDQETRQHQIDAEQQDRVRQWQGGLGLLDNELESAQKADMVNYNNEVATDKFNVEQQNNAIQKEAERSQKSQLSQTSFKKTQLNSLEKVVFGNGFGKLTPDGQESALALYRQIAGLPDDVQIDPNSFAAQELEAKVRKLSAQADISESDAYVKESTEDARIKAIIDNSKLPGLRGQLLQKNLNWYDEKARADIAVKHASVAESADRVRSRNLRDSLDLDRNERENLKTGLQAGKDELSRLRKQAETDRVAIATAEGELYGKTSNGSQRGGGGLIDRIASLEALKKRGGKSWSKAQDDQLKSLKDRRTELEGRVSKAKAAIETAGNLYNETANDVKELNKASIVKAGGNSDDRKVNVGGFTFDMGGKYAWGGKSANAKDCSGFVQAAMRSGGITSFPGSCAEQLSWLRSNAGKKAGFTDITKQLTSRQENLQEGDILYLPGSGPSGYHVKVFSGFDDSGRPVWMEAKGSKAGVGTFMDELKGKSIYGIFRPPRK